MEYIYPNLPNYTRITSRAATSNAVVSSGAVLLFTEDGETLTVKHPDGTYTSIGGSGGGSGGSQYTSTTATPADVLSGKLFVNSSGAVTTGTIPVNSGETITPGSSSQTISAGQYLSGAIVIEPASGEIDPSGTTATPDKVLSPYLFIGSNGVYSSGTIPTVSASLAANVTTVPAGYIAASQTLTVPLASSATVSGGIVTIPAGYVASNYTVSAGGNATDFYKCASVTSGGSTWTGYKAVLSDGKYNYESAVTSGLSYGSGFTPEVGKIFNHNALVKVSNLWDGIPQNGLIRYAPLSASAASDELGNTMTTYGTPTFAVDSGVPCAAMDGGSYIGYRDGITGLAAYTLGIWMKYASSEGEAMMTFSGGNYGYGGDELWLSYISNGTIQLTNGGESDYLIISATGTYSGWHHIAFVWTGSVFRLYVDGVQQGSDTSTEYDSEYTSLYAYINSLQRATSVRGDGKYAAFRLYNRVLTTAEIAALAAEFTPTNA